MCLNMVNRVMPMPTSAASCVLCSVFAAEAPWLLCVGLTWQLLLAGNEVMHALLQFGS